MRKATVTRPTHERLEQYRVDRDLGYPDLARAIKRATNVWRDPTTWSRICRGEFQLTSRTRAAAERFLAAPHASSSAAEVR
jgi:hypothetical protein